MITTRIGQLLSACLFLGLAGAAVGQAAETAGKGYPLRSVSSPAPSAAAPSVPATTVVRRAPDTVVSPPPGNAADFENQPLAFSDRRRQRSGADGEYTMPSIWPALFCVVLVCGGVGLVLYLMKNYLPGHRQLFSHPAMEVLGRAHIDQRRYVSLLRVGKRIVVIGVSPDEMRSLSEITDEEEITGIMEVARPKTEMGLNIFQRLFKRHVIETEAAETRAIANEKASQLEEQMSALRQRVRSIRETEEPVPPRVDAIG